MKTWRCQRDGSCCRTGSAVVMTTQEWDVISALPEAHVRTLKHELSPDGRFIAMQAGPCPFLDRGECSIYESRPYNCRRFQCGRWDTRTQPFMLKPMTVIKSDNDLRWSYEKNQAAHRAWALDHGWSPDA